MTKEGKMKTSLRKTFLSFAIVLAMSLGTYAHAEYAATPEKPAAQAEAAKPAGKVIPEDAAGDWNSDDG